MYKFTISKICEQTVENLSYQALNWQNFKNCHKMIQTGILKQRTSQIVERLSRYNIPLNGNKKTSYEINTGICPIVTPILENRKLEVYVWCKKTNKIANYYGFQNTVTAKIRFYLVALEKNRKK